MRPIRVNAYIGATIALALAVPTAERLMFGGWPGQWTWWALAIFICVMALSEIQAVSLPPISISIATIPHIMAVLLMPAPLAALCAACGILIEQVYRRRRPSRIVLNTAATAANVGMAGLLAHWTDLSGGGLAAEGWQPVIRLVLVASAYVALNNLLVVGVMSIAGGEPLLLVLRETVRFTAPAEIALAVLGGLAAFMWLTSPTWLPVIVIAGLLGQVALSYIGASVRKTEEMVALAERNNELYHDARAALKMRDQFLIVAAHELRTPVTTLRGYAQLLARQMKGGTLVEPKQLQRTLLTFESQTDRLGRLTEAMLDISRIDAGLVTIAPRPTDLKKLAVDVAAAAEARSTGHVVSVDGPPVLMALVDEVRLHQVVRELIDNAVAYGPTSGPIQLTLSSPPGAVTLAVLDQGDGLAPELHAQIFERFYQVQAVEHHTSGMGLGLYRCRRIAELHGGRIEVSRPPTGGTCFSVILPGAALPMAIAAAA